MSSRNAPASLTGGRGFNYEDHVAARFLLGLIGAGHPLDADLGPLTRVDWQSGDRGWRLDDLTLTFGTGAGERSAGVSVKSHKQVTESGFDEGFARRCWEQWLGAGTARGFQPDRDLLVLATGVLAEGVRAAWAKTLLEAAETSATPDRLVARLRPPADGTAGSLSSETQRALFRSLQCPADLQAGSLTDEVAAARLVRHVRLLPLDFGAAPSRATYEALADCRTATRGGRADDAEALWDALVGVAARKRGLGGSIALPELLSRLRKRFDLNDHPDYRSDWAELDRRSAERMRAVGVTVGEKARLPRRAKLRRLCRCLREDRVGVVVGESGAGKSALARRLGERGYRVVWLTADQLHAGREFELGERLGLRHPFADLVTASPARCLVVFDGIEGFPDPALQLAARLTASLRSGRRKARILMTAQPDGVSRLRAAFAAARVPADPLELIVIGPAGDGAVRKLLTRFPLLTWPALRPEFRAVLRNLKVFDWVVRLQAGGGLHDDGLTRLTAAVDRIWSHFVEAGPGGLVRAALLKRAAGAEADRLVPGLPLPECDAGDLSALPALEAVGLVRRQDERVRFAHDLFADWARLKYLIERDLPNSADTVRRAATAGWYRAVRLFAQRLLEHPEEGVDRWRAVVTALGHGEPERVIVRDLFLEALVLTEDTARLLKAVWPALTAGGGELLALLVDRFRFVGTLPDGRALAGLADPAVAARIEHLIRVPYESYWHGVLSVLAERPEDVIRCALAATAKLLRVWLSRVSPARPATSRLRRMAGRLALAMAREVQAREAECRLSVEDEVKTDVYVAALWAVPEHADEVAQLCLELAARRPEADPVRVRGRRPGRRPGGRRSGRPRTGNWRYDCSAPCRSTGRGTTGRGRPGPTAHATGSTRPSERRAWTVRPSSRWPSTGRTRRRRSCSPSSSRTPATGRGSRKRASNTPAASTTPGHATRRSTTRGRSGLCFVAGRRQPGSRSG